MKNDIRSSMILTLSNEKIRFAVMVTFLISVFLMGGGSRYDITSLVILRPLAILFIGYSLLVLRPNQIIRLKMLLALLAILALIMIIQLIPLPPSIWTGLPGRLIFAEVGELIGTDQPWRPLTLSTSRTLNSLLSLSIPFAALLLFLIQDSSRHLHILWTIFGLAIVSAIFGLLQLGGSDQSIFYLYSITNIGSPVGLFSNRNHHAIFLASLFPLVLSSSIFVKNNKKIALLFTAAFTIFIAPLILAMGSRSGLGLMLAGLTIGLAILLKIQGGFGAVLAKPAGKLGAATLFVVSAAIIYFAFENSKSLAFDRLIGSSVAEDSRYEAFPYLIELLKTYFPFGSGFGTFEFVFRAIEPADQVRYSYLNQAHSDGIQILIEAGLAGAAIVLAFTFWFTKHMISATQYFIKRKNSDTVSRRQMLGNTATIAAFIILLGSIMDYPLRTPSIMAYFAILCAWMSSINSRGVESQDR